MIRKELLAKADSLHLDNSPIFIHSLWRTGSTYLFYVFRRSKGGYWCYQEPIHEVALNCRDRAEDLLLFEGEKMLSLRHPMLEKPYFLELYETWEYWREFISKQIIYDGYFDTDGNAYFVNYLKSLITHAKGRPVIQECRTSCRIMATKKALGGIHSYLWRNPWDQWWSFKSTSYFNAVLQLILNTRVHPHAISLARQEIGFSEFHDESIDRELQYFHENPLSAENNYLVFYLLWCLGLLEGIEYADIIINIDMLSNSQEYRNNIHKSLSGFGIVDIDFSDSNVPQLYYMEEDKTFFYKLEERVYGILLLSGYSEQQLKKISRIRLDYEPRLRSLSLVDIPSESLWPNCSRAREIALRYETEASRYLHQMRCQICDEQKKHELSRSELEVLRNSEIALQRDLYLGQQKIGELSDSLLASQKQISTQTLKLNDHEMREEELSRQIQGERATLRRLEQEKNDRERELSEEIGRARSKIEELLRTLALREKEIVGLRMDVESLCHTHQWQAQHLESRLTEKQDELSQKMVAFKTLEAEFETKIAVEKETCLMLQQKLYDVEHLMLMMRSSLSWRIMSPIRKISSHLTNQKGNGLPASSGIRPDLLPDDIHSVIKSGNLIIHKSPREIDCAMPLSPSIKEMDQFSFPSTLEDLLSFYDRAFIEYAYRTLLGRVPDGNGRRFYLDRLRNGTSKLQIVVDLALSPEGKNHKPDLPGLNAAVTRYRRGKMPLIGWLFRVLTGGEGDGPLERKLRSIENQIFLLGEESSRRFDHIELALSSLQHLRLKYPQPQSDIRITDDVHKSQSANTPNVPIEPVELKRLSPNVRNIYRQLKSAIAS